MGSGDSPGLQNRRTASFGVVGGFDSHSLPPCLGSFAALRISARGSDAAQAPQLQNRRTASFDVVGGFDSHSLPPTFRRSLDYARDAFVRLSISACASDAAQRLNFACGLPLR
jgi:hypothetical protein